MGIKRLAGLDLADPIFNWDEVPIKQGLHNRHLVGLMAMNTFLDVTGLSLYGKRTLVVGYGPVGRGAADAARGFGAVVEVCDVDPAARLAAAHLGFLTTGLEEGLSRADVVFTATAPSPGRPSPLQERRFPSQPRPHERGAARRRTERLHGRGPASSRPAV